MSRHSLSKSTVSNISKFLLDKNFFYFTSLILILFCILKNLLIYYSWEKNFLSYYPENITITNMPILSFSDYLILIALNFISLIIPSIIIRFSIGILLIKSQIKVQRFFTLIVMTIFILSTNFSGYFFGKSSIKSSLITNTSSVLNFLFIIFFIISFMVFFININENLYKKKIRIILLFSGIIIFLIYDWKKTENFRSESKYNIKNTNILFILENNSNSNFESLKKSNEFKYLEKNFIFNSYEISLVSNMQLPNYISLLTGLYPFESGIRNEIPNSSFYSSLEEHMKKVRKDNLEISFSNISNPSSIATLTKYLDSGVQCDNNIQSLKNYFYLQNLNPILLFLPNLIVLKFFPMTLCLNKAEDISDIILEDFYLRLNTKKDRKKLIVTVFPEKSEPANLIKIIEKINETLESNELNINIFSFRKDKKTDFIELTKKSSPNLSIQNIINLGNIYFNNYKNDISFNYFEENNNANLNKIFSVINNRVSLKFNENIQQSLGLKRFYKCSMNETKDISYSFEINIREFPQKIISSNKDLNSTCEKQIEKSLFNDINFFINKQFFEKIFILYSEKT